MKAFLGQTTASRTSKKDKQDIEDHMLNCDLCFAEASEFLVVELQTCIESRKEF